MTPITLLAAGTTAAAQLSGTSVGCYANNAGSMLSSCVLPQLTAATGGPALFGVLIGGTLLLATGIAGQDLAPVATVLALVGGIAVPLVPQSYANVAIGILVAGLVVVIMGIANRYVLEGVAS